jgi:hypothetical protein
VVLAGGLLTLTVVLIECVAFCVFAGLSSMRTPVAMVRGIVWLTFLHAIPLITALTITGGIIDTIWAGMAASLISPAVAYNVFATFGAEYPIHGFLGWVASCAVHGAIGYALLRGAARRYEARHAREA